MANHQKRIAFETKIIVLAVLCFLSLPSFALDNSNLMKGVYYATIITQDVGIVMGVGLFLAGIFKMKRYGEMRTFMSHQITISRPLSMMFVGVCLMAMPVFTKSLMIAFWGYSNPLAYPALGTAESTELIEPIIALIRLVGLLGVIRGLLLFSRAGGEQSQPGQVGKAMLHILGGLLCMHVLNTAAILMDVLDFNPV